MLEKIMEPKNDFEIMEVPGKSVAIVISESRKANFNLSVIVSEAGLNFTNRIDFFRNVEDDGPERTQEIKHHEDLQVSAPVPEPAPAPIPTASPKLRALTTGGNKPIKSKEIAVMEVNRSILSIYPIFLIVQHTILNTPLVLSLADKNYPLDIPPSGVG